MVALWSNKKFSFCWFGSLCCFLLWNRVGCHATAIGNFPIVLTFRRGSWAKCRTDQSLQWSSLSLPSFVSLISFLSFLSSLSFSSENCLRDWNSLKRNALLAQSFIRFSMAKDSIERVSCVCYLCRKDWTRWCRNIHRVVDWAVNLAIEFWLWMKAERSVYETGPVPRGYIQVILSHQMDLCAIHINRKSWRFARGSNLCNILDWLSIRSFQINLWISKTAILWQFWFYILLCRNSELLQIAGGDTVKSRWWPSNFLIVSISVRFRSVR
jgi:hypothetical protein